MKLIEEIKRRIELKKQLIELTHKEIKSLERKFYQEIKKQTGEP